MARVVVVGAGVAGLGAALALGRDGHDVTVLERDATPLPASPAEAFAWDRRGAPQVRHSHAFLARLRNLLRDRFPDVLADLLAAGATELRFTDMLPPAMTDRAPRPGDDDLVAIACRRTTFEWVLRRSVLAAPGVRLLDGAVVDGLDAEPAGPGGVPRVTGVLAEVGGSATVLRADTVVIATGTRSAVPAWMAASRAGMMEEEEEDTGIVYFSRFYELPDATVPVAAAPVAVDLGYLKFAVFPGDNGTFSVTLAVASDDAPLRSMLLGTAAFDATVLALPLAAPWVADGRSTPITDVQVMARLVNRRRRFTDGDLPLATGVHAVGDAHTCTNPLYGRGCSLAMVQAVLLADALREHAGDPVAAALAYEAASDREIAPWYRAAVAQDQANRLAPGEATGDDGTLSFRSILQDGVLPAARVDPVVYRAFVRAFNLLDRPDALMADTDLAARVVATWQARHDRPPEPPSGPRREDLVATLAGLAA